MARLNPRADANASVCSDSSPPAVDAELEKFCERIYPKLVGALSLTYRDPTLAEEFAQDALTRTVEHWDHIRGMDDPEAYVIRIGFNLGRSWWRRRLAERRARSRLDKEATWSEADPTRELEVRRILATLTPRQREAIVHRYYLGRDVRDTATSMGCAEGTVRALTAQGIAALRSAGLGVDDG